MRYKAVIFDLDGTLLDTLADLASSCNRVLVQLGYPVHPNEAYRYFVGDGMTTLVQRILPEDKQTSNVINHAVELFRQDYAENWAVDTTLYEGVGSMLDRLKALGVRICILSNKPDGFTQLCVSKLLGQWTFELIYGQRDGVPRKPDPAGAFALLQELGLKNEEVLYVGDTATDMKTAAAAQLDKVGVAWGFRDVKELQDSGADYIIDHPGQLIDIIESR
ncbi:MAG: HAD family hydrolase [Desulfobulbus propionicus]|nr:MAG: HAD family hydrolase [Desulfobulbus propionicus]